MQDSMTEAEMVDYITQHEVFSGFNDSEKTNFMSLVSFCSVERNKTIFEIDDKPDHIFMLTEGSLQLQFPNRTKLDLSPGELIGEIGVLNGDFRLGKLVAIKNTKMIAINMKTLFESKDIPASIGLEIIQRLSKRVTNYLRSVQQTSTKEIIELGEDNEIEFKSTLRWNLKSERKDGKITFAILKTLAAFLNSSGGTLIVGVADDGEILGLENDRFENEDKILLFLTSKIKSNIGTLYLEHISYHLEKINNKSILRIDVTRGNKPCYITDENLEYFFVRTGPSTTNLPLSKVYEYVQNRFFNS